jgi:hypothetical protein
MTNRKKLPTDPIEDQRRTHYFDEEGFTATTFKLPKRHREALDLLGNQVGEPISMIIRRLVREELYYRGLIDDELL